MHKRYATNNNKKAIVHHAISFYQAISHTLPRGKFFRKTGLRFVCPKVKAGAALATLRLAPLYWAAIWALKARQFSG